MGSTKTAEERDAEERVYLINTYLTTRSFCDNMPFPPSTTQEAPPILVGLFALVNPNRHRSY